MKRVILLSDSLKLTAQLGLLLYIYFGSNNIAAMSISAFVYGIASSFFAPSSYRIIPLITLDKEREKCNSILSILGGIFGVVGPLLGATIVIFLGFKSALLIDIITFLASLFLFSLMVIETPGKSNLSSTDEKNDHTQTNSSTYTIPKWSTKGIYSWFFITVCIGFMGNAGPFLIIQNHSKYSWAMVATTVAIGSLIGSALVMSGTIANVSWKKIHFLCSLFLPIQLLVFNSTMNIYLVAVFGFLGSFLTTISGVKWDTKVQNELSPFQPSIFAAKDQLWMNTAVPLGIILFSISSFTGSIDLLLPIISTIAGLSFILLLYNPEKGSQYVKNKNQ